MLGCYKFISKDNKRLLKAWNNETRGWHVIGVDGKITKPFEYLTDDMQKRVCKVGDKYEETIGSNIILKGEK